MGFGINSKVTGFASPAQGYEENAIDLNEVLVKHPASTYFFRLDTADMEKLGLPNGALLVVDRSLKPSINQLILLKHEGQFLCRLMEKNKGKTVFSNGNTEIAPIPDETEVIGVVTACIQVFNNDFPH